MRQYEKGRAIEFIRVVPDLKVNRLDVALTATGNTAVATWTHTDTGLILRGRLQSSFTMLGRRHGDHVGRQG